MSSHVLNDFEVQTANTRRRANVYMFPAREPSVPTTRVSISVTNRLTEGSMRDGSCIKGMISALVLEAGMALAAYGIWMIWHVLR
jgi:hypothetical protein